MGIVEETLEGRLSHGLRVQAIGMKLGRSAQEAIRRKAEAMTRRYPGLLGLAVELRRVVLGPRRSEYLVKARLVLPGYDRIVAKRSEELGLALANAFEVADRQLRRRATRARF
ncbi:HPF/RaiA family ribosome-associated protein [Pelagicoccus sp. SDUM812003]|uniref:HPF/RaiA family ribosome-associated protein n=1 Tax=Pelagicoccus sp. SDUM812003 TaxID=3041267 RepID=UPI00280F60BD|nr:HPF/RaiA family ribosome-associated protein [Pelagicoccus sp. SDUM812003]MDQ8204292.1 HPF/RaiA family ribosome-associated protein [Pelagicoccus sp. SDUM812003]